MGNGLDWFFRFNAAHKRTEIDTIFIVEDTLEDTMEWDMELNNVNSVVEFQGRWFNLETARNMKIGIEIQGKNLKITIPTYIYLDGNWVKTLNGQEITVRLAAKVTEETMNNKSIKYVHNSSIAKVTGSKWNVDSKDSEYWVEILRTAGWASGTKPCDLKIIKKLQNKEIHIKGVEFVLEREDKKI